MTAFIEARGPDYASRARSSLPNSRLTHIPDFVCVNVCANIVHMSEPYVPHHKRATKEQRRERIEFCAGMLRSPVLKDGTILTPHRMAAMCAQQFDFSVRQGWSYLRKASDRIKRTETPDQQLRGDWVSRALESIIASSGEKTADKLGAVALYMKRNGLEAPVKNANTDSAGNDIIPRTPEQDKAELIRLMQQAQKPEPSP